MIARAPVLAALVATVITGAVRGGTPAGPPSDPPGASPSRDSGDSLITAPRALDPRRAGVGRQVPDAHARTIDGSDAPISWRSASPSPLTVVAMTSRTCPLSARFAPVLTRLDAEYAERGVRFLFIDSTGLDSTEALAARAKELGVGGRLLDDRERRVASAFGATSTTEVFLVDDRFTLLYRGAPSDQYGIGYAHDAPRRRYLEDAIRAALERRRPEVEATSAPGCALEPAAGASTAPTDRGAGTPAFDATALDSAGSAAPVTYAREVARIMQSRCVECHREGGAAPFALDTFDAVSKRATMIRRVVDAGLMPPWFAAACDGPSPWANDRSLTVDEKRTIARWVESGAPLGVERDLPLPRRFADGEWTIGAPDLVIELPAAIEIPAEGIMPYQEVVVSAGVDADRWVRGIEILPSDRTVVHHALVFALPPEAASNGRLAPGVDVDETRGFFAAYVPGNGAVVYPDGFARRLRAGAQLLFQIHYTPNGRATRDRTRLGLVFRETAPEHVVRTTGIMNARIRIPAGAANHEEHAEQRVPFDARVLAFLPHMHVRGKAFRFELEGLDGARRTLLDVPRYDFDWQLRYLLREPLDVPAGSIVRCTAWYDNSAANAANLDPEKVVRWGKQSFDEMLIGFIEYVLAVEDPSMDDGQGPVAPRTAGNTSTTVTRRMTLREFLDRFDANADGRLERGELPEHMRGQFQRFDRNGDGVVSSDDFAEATPKTP